MTAALRSVGMLPLLGFVTLLSLAPVLAEFADAASTMAVRSLMGFGLVTHQISCNT
jgi:hypothetical protein